jgi:NAD(P)-dependent dehydrogenase (short-subunit alcohol dehydrogenase family)
MELFSLKGKNIVVTGALGLLGREHVKAIAMAGGNPLMLDLNQKKLEEFAQNISQSYGVDCKGFQVDITDEQSVKENCELIEAQYSLIDGLINNAANNPKVEGNRFNFSRLENFPLDIWEADVAVSLTGSFLCSKYFGLCISKNPDGGSIINISSDLGIIAPNQNLYKKNNITDENQSVKPVTYSVTKHAIIGLTRYLSTYWADKNVRSNAICPGGVFNNQPKEFIDALSQLIPMGRMANKNEYRGLVIFLLSQASSYINGAIISADGGRSAW